MQGGPDRPQWPLCLAARRCPITSSVIRVAVGLGFGAFGILLELGLDQVVGIAPWLVVSFVAGFLAAVLGGLTGGVVAAVVGFAGQQLTIPAWVPAVRELDGAGWPLELSTACLAYAIGILVRRLILQGAFDAPAAAEPSWNDGLDATTGLPWRDGPTAPGTRRTPAATGHGSPPPRPPSREHPSPADVAVLGTAIRDFGAVRTPIQVADALARHATSLSGATSATVYLQADGRDGLVPVGRTGAVDPGAPARIAIETVVGTADGDAPAGSDATLIPIVIQATGRSRVVGAIRLRGPDPRPPRPSPLLGAVAQLAADALEHVRLDAARRSADDEAAGAGRRLAILGGLALELVGGTTVDEVTRTLLGFAVDDLAAGFAAVHVTDDGTGSFRLVDARGFPAGLVAGQAIIAADAASPVTQAARDHAPVEVLGEDGWRVAYPRTSNVPAITGVRAISAIPLEASGVVHGVLTIGWRTADARSTADRDVLAAAAAQGAQALERAILHAHDEDARRFQEAFIGVVSHELRTPITTILAGSRLLRRRLDGDERAADLTDDIVIEADRLTRIVDDLLVLSRLERRHLTIGDDPVHLDHLLAKVVRSEASRWPDHQFEIPTSASRHVVLGDETYVEQILRNLISNAAKYSPVGTTIRVVIDDGPGGEVLVRVLDEGPGVAPGEVDELFSLFYRSPTTAATASGAGIGLFVSRRLVTEMGGRVWARPREEGGSEFGFSLGSYPIDEAEPDDFDPVATHGATAPDG